MSMRDLILRKIMEDKFRASVQVQSNCPKFIDVYNSSTVALDEILDTSNLPSVGFKTNTSAVEYVDSMNVIKNWLQIASSAMVSLVGEYEVLTKGYQDLSIRIFNESKEFKAAVDRIINFSCIYIPADFANQTENSIVGKVGSYICLPFYIRTAKMYDGAAFTRIFSSGDIIFSNISRAGNIPLKEPISSKVSSSQRNISFTVSSTIEKTVSNMIYYKFLNEVIGSKLILLNGSLSVYEKTFREAEVLANFEPVEFDKIIIEIQYNNTNTDKPFAVQLESLDIFKEIQFAKWGQFESNPFFIGNASKVENISLAYDSIGDSSKTNTTDLVSVSSDPQKLAYNRLGDGDTIDVSVHKFRHSQIFNGLTYDGVSFPEVDIAGKKFFSHSMDESNDDLWNINFEQALVFHGLNQDFAETAEVGTSYYAQHFENWTKVGTYWKSMIYVTDSEAWVEIGKNVCLINGREFTGKFKMPKGISTVEVHEQDMDFRFGKELVNDLSKKDDIYSDPLFPFNFAYTFAGLPEYDINGDIEDKLTRKYTVNGVTTLFLNEPFIPLSIEIVDNALGQPYKLQLTSGVSVPGTYSIEPYSGKVKVYPASTGEVNLDVNYRRASLFKKPVGVMFNRLLTFMPIKALIGLQNATADMINYKYAFDNEAFFTLDGNTQSRALLLQNTSADDPYEFNDIQHSQVIFNRKDENLYVSAKIEMETTDRYLTPVVKDIYLSMG